MSTISLWDGSLSLVNTKGINSRPICNNFKVIFVTKTQIFFQIIETYSPLIPLATLLIKRSRKSSWVILLISYLAIYLSLVYAANNFFSGNKNNNIIYIVLTGVTFCFFALILEQFLSAKFKFYNRVVILIAVLFFVANAIFWEGTFLFNSYSSAAGNLILLGYCIYYYKLQLEKPQIIFVERLPSFWIVSGIFIYSAGNIFLFSMYNSLTQNHHLFTYEMWDINIILILIMNISFAKGIQCASLK